MHQTENPNIPPRLKWGWLAWESLVGYISQHHSPDAILKVEVHPMEYIIGWSATLTWGSHFETVRDQMSFADALNQLWLTVNQNHALFEVDAEKVRKPVGYNDDEWLDPLTYESFSRIVNTTDTVFKGDWLIIFLYRPVEDADKRLQTRLVADNNRVNRSGYGVTMRDACRMLYHNAAPVYQKYRNPD